MKIQFRYDDDDDEVNNNDDDGNGDDDHNLCIIFIVTSCPFLRLNCAYRYGPTYPPTGVLQASIL